MLNPEQHVQQDLLHEALGLWAQDHADRYPDISVIDYDPSNRPEQRIETFKTAASSALRSMPPEKLIETLRGGYLKTLGPDSSAVIAAVAASLGTQANALLNEGRSIAILANHADQLHDIGALCGAVAILFGSAEGIQRNATILNKAMTRESFRSTPIADLFGSFGNVYWVVPETTSASRWRVPADIASYVNAGAMRAMVTDMREGIILTFAPSGSAMRQELTEEGTLESLVIPAVGAATTNLLSRFGAYVVAATWQNQVRVGPLTRLPPPLRGDRDARESDRQQILTCVMETLASMTADLAEVPVRYDSP